MDRKEFTRRRSGEFVALNHELDDMPLYEGRAAPSSLARAAGIAAVAPRRGVRVSGTQAIMEYETMVERLVPDE